MPRRFIRHPTRIPIQLSAREKVVTEEQVAVSKDISVGGLSCLSDHLIAPGAEVKVAIFVEREPFKILGYVVWCKPCADGYLVGIGFTDLDATYALRMVEQICHIEAYRQQVRENEGRCLSSEEAAKEWIAQYAADFPEHPS